MCSAAGKLLKKLLRRKTMSWTWSLILAGIAVVLIIIALILKKKQQ